jgi:hypothetical protein
MEGGGVNPCEKCGRAPKVLGQGQHYCADCKEAAAWAVERKRMARAVVQRKPCLICGGVKEPGHGREFCLRCAEARKPKRRCMSCPAEIVPPARKCETCKALAVAKRRAFDRQRNRKYRADGVTFPSDRRRRKSKRDNEGARMRHRLRAERAGRIVGPVRKLPKVAARARHVPAAPLVPFLRQEIAKGVTIEELGERAPMRPHELRKVLDGQTTDLRDFQADRLCVALGLQFNLVYDLAQIA